MPGLTFACPHAEQTPTSPERLCEQMKTWKAQAQEGTHHDVPVLLVTNHDAACPTCGRTGVARTDRLVIVGAQG